MDQLIPVTPSINGAFGGRLDVDTDRFWRSGHTDQVAVIKIGQVRWAWRKGGSELSKSKAS
jgi:hypothetical protein